ncbi:MAG: type II toxin-antitoxin system VapC family toxin [Sphingobacteriaceae bacterium]|nr:MAG: type II toxin-antitoxin system VapC family toxin [Sphingobacteriaceae bacterium]
MAQSKIICDTDVMIDYLDSSKVRYPATKIIVNEKIGIRNVILSAVTKMELIAGVRNNRELNSLSLNIKGLQLLLINPEISRVAIDLFEIYKLSHNLALADSIIAATAIVTEIPLFTYNLKDFKFIRELELYQPATF